MVRIINRTCLFKQFEEIRGGIHKLNRTMGLQPSSHTPKLNQIKAGQSQPKKQSPVSGPICNHKASGQAKQTRDVEPMLTKYRSNVFDADPVLTLCLVLVLKSVRCDRAVD